MQLQLFEAVPQFKPKEPEMEDFVLDEAAYPSRPPKLPAAEAALPGEHWSEMFRNMEKYDWNNPKWKKENKGLSAFLPIPLSVKPTSPWTSGYFMIVSLKDYRRMTTYPDGSPKSWNVNIQVDNEGEITKLYARRRGRVGEPSVVLAHREVLDCLDDHGDADHLNGCGLDNRWGSLEDPVNLILGPKSHNHYNNRQKRRVNTDILYRGVLKKRKNKKGQQLYSFISAKRLGKRWVKNEETGKLELKDSTDYHRDGRVWLSQEMAGAAYNKYIEKLTEGRKMFVHRPETVDFPVFPPLMDSEPVRPHRARRSRAMEDVPF